jgi:hypothetical protein
LDFKTSLSKKLVFALANVIDTDQGNPFEVAVSCLKRILYLPAKSFFSRI